MEDNTAEPGPMNPLDDGVKSDDSLGQLIKEARGGSREAFGELTEACRTYLLLVANQELPTDIQGKVAASDLVQDTFVEANRDFPNFVGQSRLKLMGWLRQILLNNVTDAYRRYEQAAKRRASREIPLDRAGTASSLALELAVGDTTPSQAAMAGEEQAELDRALTILPEHYREVIVLRHRDGLSFEEISGRVDRSADAVRKTWVRAIRQVQQNLESIADGP